jgi:hypothetical protein
MKKMNYIKPSTSVVTLRVSDPVLYEGTGDLFEGSHGEASGIGHVGGKENDGFFDDVPFGSLWDDDPVEDPFKLDE